MMMTRKMVLEGKNVLVTGGTGSLGNAIVRRMLTGELGRPARVTVFSRDEAKQHDMRVAFLRRGDATDDVIYKNSTQMLRFAVGDVRDYPSVVTAVRDAHVVVHAAALKQVPTCEYFPYQAIQTNLVGTEHLIRALRETASPVETVVGISTDKACKPINVMGMTKAIMERMLIEANLETSARIVCVRYGNVVASRGSVVPLFLDQIAQGGPVTLTMREMTRFLLTLDQAVDTVFAALQDARRGELLIPRAPAANVADLADAVIDGRPIEVKVTGIRPGEKIHEIMVSEEECFRTSARGNYYVIHPMLPELAGEESIEAALTGEYSSAAITVRGEALRSIVAPYLHRASGTA